MQSESKIISQEDYNGYYEQHQLVNSLIVYLPLIKMDLLMTYGCKAPMDIFEKYVCRCIQQGINDRYAIMDALALDGEVVDDITTKLIQQGILYEQKDKLFFSNEEQEMIQPLLSLQTKRREVTWCYKGLINAERKIDIHMGSLENTVSIEKVLKEAHSLFLLPNVILEIKPEELSTLSPKMLHYEGKEQEEILEVYDLKMIRERTVCYEAYQVLFFKGVEGDVKLLAHELHGSQKVDEAFTKTLQRLYDRSEFYDQLRPENAENEERLAEFSRQISMSRVVK